MAKEIYLRRKNMQELIQWPKAKYWTRTYNPVIGCQMCSPACYHCYAGAWAKRFGQSFEPHDTKQNPPRKGIVFCGNMTDLFGEWNYEDGGGIYHKSCDYIAETLGYDKRNPYKDKAVYLWLTKRMEIMAEWVAEGGWETYRSLDDADCIDFKDCDMSNHYFGFTAENQEWYDKRVVRMNNWPEWVNTWVSCEPLLGPINLYATSEPRYKWVVVGCESGPNRRPCKIEWVESIVQQCRNAGVPVFVKQLDINGVCVTDINKFPEHLRIRQVPWAGKLEAK